MPRNQAESRNPPSAAEDKRREPRIAATGEVRLMAGESVIEGSLVDISSSGFRATHSGPLLQNGDVVRFQYTGASGKARVIWNRITTERTETGFLIL